MKRLLSLTLFLLAALPLYVQAQSLIRPEQMKPAIILPYVEGSLPAVVAGNAGRLATVTDNARGLWVQSPTTWFAVNGEATNVQAFGAKGDGVTDDTTAVQAAVTAGNAQFPPGTYLVSAAITIPSNRRLFGFQNSIIQLKTATNKAVLSIGTSTDVLIEGLTIDGNRVNQDDATCNAGCYGIFTAPGATRLLIRDNTVKNIQDVGIGLTGVTHARVVNNSISNTGWSGVRVGGASDATNCQFVVVANNVMTAIGAAGVEASMTKDTVIAGNVINDAAKEITQQAILVGYGLDLGDTADGERVLVADNVVRTTTNHGGIRVGGTDITVSGNVVSGTGERGIFVGCTNDVGTYCVRVHVIGNTVTPPTNVADVGIGLLRCNGCSAVGNHVTLSSTSTAAAFSIQDTTGLTLSDNVGEEGNSCLRLIDPQEAVISGNRCKGQTTKGLHITGTSTTKVSITGNLITNLDGGATGGIDTITDSPTYVTVVGNTLRTASAIISSASATSVTEGNSELDNACSINSATALNIGGARANCRYLEIVQSVTPVTSVLASSIGRIVVLKFIGVVTMTDDNANLDLAGNFVTTTNDTLSLISNGVGWTEAGRSIN